ncbi:hypothetical protein LP362_09870 (plasmid) [Lactobacillus gasseri]|uniref:hypothetical protein n=1 Tax=Lactobacillus gasseri TaxID=1596 RepID=UPI001E4CD341|nr:hypothetical protein [Lactobacillus gasseri]UFN99760.1 hypothetical protein LP362_09870 [Lactobacillus gasseri]
MPSSNFYEALSLKTRVIHRNELNKIKESEIHDEEINSFSENFIFVDCKIKLNTLEK